MLVHRLSYRSNTFVLSTLALLAAIVLASCTVGPKYQRPPVPAPPEFKETRKLETCSAIRRYAQG